MTAEPEVVVLGAGAAGLLAAIRSARLGARTLLLEKNRRPGVKILASGGGRCNLTTTREKRALLDSFEEDQAAFLRFAFKALPPFRLRALFEEWGVALVEEELEKVFPRSGKARSVLDALVSELEGAGAELRLHSPVRGVEVEADGRFAVLVGSADDETLARILTPNVVLATGGASVPRSGTTGDGYCIAEALGVALSPRFPALVGVEVFDHEAGECSGTSIEEVEAQLFAEGRLVQRSRRPVLITHKGLSGPGAMDLSGRLAELGGGEIRLDLMPGRTPEEADRELREAAARPGARVGSLLPESMPKRLRPLLLRRAGLEGNAPTATLRKDERARLLAVLRGWSFRCRAPRDWDRAEVTRGGVRREEVDPKRLELRRHPGFFVVGEVLDVDGPIGGFNFQAAFATGWVGGEAAARRALRARAERS